jgi:hypothetical protein
MDEAPKPMASNNWKGLITAAAAIAGIGALAVYIVKMLRERGEEVDGAIDELLDFYTAKAAELDRIVSETELHILC